MRMVNVVELRASLFRRDRKSFNFVSIKFYDGKRRFSILECLKKRSEKRFSMRIKHRLIINDIGVHFALAEPGDAVFLF